MLIMVIGVLTLMTKAVAAAVVTAVIVTHMHSFNCSFSGKPGLASYHLDSDFPFIPKLR